MARRDVTHNHISNAHKVVAVILVGIFFLYCIIKGEQEEEKAQKRKEAQQQSQQYR
jgi:hypothetical protein